eukprot:GFKZ01011102.1.p1 GENE.GFKZ01011102.1~~GFKZ01011102.1.p1  ORF type:complete len:646 (+),score=82.36 GFKZ01011102.1:322-2259(+)
MFATNSPTHMSSPAYLLQASSFLRARVLTSSFVSRSCPTFISHSPPFPHHGPTHPFRCISSANANENTPSHPIQVDTERKLPSASSSVDTSLPPPPTADDIIAAFESTILADLEADAEEYASPAQRRKAEKERKLAAQREEHFRKLEIINSLPEELIVQTAPSKCPGCGTTFQSRNPDLPGFLPENTMRELSQSAVVPPVQPADDDSPPVKIRDRPPVCQRCYRLTHYGAIEPQLRVSTKRPARAVQSAVTQEVAPTSPNHGKCKELSPATFRKTLETLRSTHAVIIYLVDIFDFHGSFIKSLRDIVGRKNPIVLAVNKVDLLPKDYKPSRVENWIAQECNALALRDVAAIHLISSKKGTGVKALMAEAMQLAKQRRADVYVIGAANVGKSSFINQLISLRKSDGLSGEEKKARRKPSKQNQFLGAITTSVVPGTTLDVIRIPLGRKVNLYDTPGLMMPHQLTNFLEEKELKAVLPSSNVDHVTFRLEQGKAIYIGALARIEVVEGKAFFFTCFFSPKVKLHPGRAENSAEFARQHVGGLLTPPYSEEGLEQLGEWTTKTFSMVGEGWRKASVDVVFSGLGWIAVTGPGPVKLRVCVPQGVGVFTREPLMPFEAQTGVSKYTGTRAVNRKAQNKTAKKRRQSLDF